MKYIFFLSGDYISLAREEVLSLFHAKTSHLHGQLLIADLQESKKIITEKSNRLGLSKRIYKVLFECNSNEPITHAKEFDWNSTYKENFCIRIRSDSKSKYFEKQIAEIVWDSLKNPKVNLKNPKTLFEIFLIKNKAYATILISEIKGDFEERKPHKRPFPHPGSMHPKIARALINLSGVEKGQVILDPFCGTGGFLIESGLMQIKSVGYDISRNMIEGCKDNLSYFKIKNSKIKIKNALDIKEKFDFVVTDLPYGLNSNLYLELKNGTLKGKDNKINLKTKRKGQIERMEKFYLDFLKAIKGKCKSAIIIFPSFVEYKKIIKQSGFALDKVFSIYVHRSLSRKITRIK